MRDECANSGSLGTPGSLPYLQSISQTGRGLRLGVASEVLIDRDAGHDDAG